MSTYRNSDGWGLVGDETRRTILLSLAEAPRSVGELAAQLPVSRPAVSQHLKLLKDAGLVAEQSEGRRRIYRLDEAGLLALRDQLDAFWRNTLEGFGRVLDESENGEHA